MSAKRIEILTWWLIEAVRQKVAATQMAQTAAQIAVENQVPPLTPLGKAGDIAVVTVNITRIDDFTSFLAEKFFRNPMRYFDLVFPNCSNAVVRMAGSLPRSGQANVAPAAYVFSWPKGKYVHLAGYLEELSDSQPSGRDDEKVMRDLIRAIKGKTTDLDDARDDQKCHALATACVMLGSEGSRCVGMLAAGIMAMSLAKWGELTFDDLFRAGAWPAADKLTEAALQEIDRASYARVQTPPQKVPLSTNAQRVFDGFAYLLGNFITKALERDKQSERNARVSTNPKRHHGINSDLALKTEAVEVLQRKVLNHL